MDCKLLLIKLSYIPLVLACQNSFAHENLWWYRLWHECKCHFSFPLFG